MDLDILSNAKAFLCYLSWTKICFTKKLKPKNQNRNPMSGSQIIKGIWKYICLFKGKVPVL